jgi:hypothetical protein
MKIIRLGILSMLTLLLSIATGQAGGGHPAGHRLAVQ